MCAAASFATASTRLSSLFQARDDAPRLSPSNCTSSAPLCASHSWIPFSKVGTSSLVFAWFHCQPSTCVICRSSPLPAASNRRSVLPCQVFGSSLAKYHSSARTREPSSFQSTLIYSEPPVKSTRRGTRGEATARLRALSDSAVRVMASASSAVNSAGSICPAASILADSAASWRERARAVEACAFTSAPKALCRSTVAHAAKAKASTLRTMAATASQRVRWMCWSSRSQAAKKSCSSCPISAPCAAAHSLASCSAVPRSSSPAWRSSSCHRIACRCNAFMCCGNQAALSSRMGSTKRSCTSSTHEAPARSSERRM